MEPSVTFLAFLSEHAGLELVARRDDDACLAAALVKLSHGRRAIFVERTYRDGVAVIVDPSDGEVATFHAGDLWDIWNSKRAQRLGGIV